MDFQFAHVTYTRFDEPKVKSSTQNASIENAELTLGTTSAMWRSRGYLPHFDRKGCIQSITFRLSDSLPKAKLDQLESIVAILPTETDREQATRAQIEKWLDAGMGSCALKHQAVAKKVEDALLYFDGDRYKLIAWCIMPNHVHVLIEQMEKTSKDHTVMEVIHWTLGKATQCRAGARRSQRPPILDARILGSLYSESHASE